MTTYGTIPTSSSSSSPPVNVEYISRAKERIKEGLGTRRPWRELFDIHSLGFPRSLGDALSRVKANLGYFRMNYVIVALLILFLSLLWHPVSLIVFIAMMAVWLFLYFLRDEPMMIFGRLVNDRIVLIVLSVVTLVVLFLTHATENILIALAVAVVVVLLHAVIRRTDDHVVDEESGGLWRGPPSS